MHAWLEKRVLERGTIELFVPLFIFSVHILDEVKTHCILLQMSENNNARESFRENMVKVFA